MAIVRAILAICGRGRRRKRMQEECRTLGVPKRRTIQHLRAYVVSSGIFRYIYTKRPYPFKVSVNLCVSPSTSNIFMVLSDEQVASLLP